MLTRRKWLRRVLWGSAALAGGACLGTAYGFWEASQIRIERQVVAVPNLPDAFTGTTIAVLADLHHGPFVSLGFIREAVRMTQALEPDLIALVGDFAHHGTTTDVQLPPCLEALSVLQAPLGVFAVPGNHDMQARGRVYRKLIAATPLRDLTNRNESVARGRARLYVAGVDDLWWGEPSLKAALDGIPPDAATLLLCHNPDYAEEKPDIRVSLMLSGHLHGGQIYLPVLSPWTLPSRYGNKYVSGLVQGPASKVFVSRGLGESGVPLRVNAPPEINLLTLVQE